MLAFLLQAIFAASQPDSDVPLTRKHLQEMKKRPPPKMPIVIPKKKVRKWKGVYEHKDTPTHHH